MKQAHNISPPSFHQSSQDGSGPSSRQQASVLLSQNSNTKTWTSVTARSGPGVWGGPGASWSLNQVNQWPCCSAPWICWHFCLKGRSSPAGRGCRSEIDLHRLVRASAVMGTLLHQGDRVSLRIQHLQELPVSNTSTRVTWGPSTHALWSPLCAWRETWAKYINMYSSYVFHTSQPLYCCPGWLLRDAFQYFV